MDPKNEFCKDGRRTKSRSVLCLVTGKKIPVQKGAIMLAIMKRDEEEQSNQDTCRCAVMRVERW